MFYFEQIKTDYCDPDISKLVLLSNAKETFIMNYLRWPASLEKGYKNIFLQNMLHQSLNIVSSTDRRATLPFEVISTPEYIDRIDSWAGGRAMTLWFVSGRIMHLSVSLSVETGLTNLSEMKINSGSTVLGVQAHKQTIFARLLPNQNYGKLTYGLTVYMDGCTGNCGNRIWQHHLVESCLWCVNQCKPLRCYIQFHSDWLPD